MAIPPERADILRKTALKLRALATAEDAAEIRDLLRHLAEQCERLAQRLAREPS